MTIRVKLVIMINIAGANDNTVNSITICNAAEMFSRLLKSGNCEIRHPSPSLPAPGDEAEEPPDGAVGALGDVPDCACAIALLASNASNASNASGNTRHTHRLT
jgi:hypothetical protein